MDNFVFDFMEESFTNQSVSCVIDNDGVKFPKADLFFSKEGLTQLSTGAQLNYSNPENYELGVFLGKGSSGYVQEAFFKRNDAVAIKTVNIFDKDKRHQLMNDLKIFLNKDFQCENLIKFNGAYYDQDTVKIVLELMDLGSLRDILKFLLQKNTFMEEQILARLTYQILNGLAFLHTYKHQIHRDIKPENILINSFGKVKLSDFGISRELEKTQSLCQTFIGTMTYMSPERMQGLEYNYSSDLWSLGLILYELSTGKYPYPLNGGYIEIIQNIVTSNSPLLPENQEYSKEYKDFLALCLNKDKNCRSSAIDLLKHPWITKHCTKRTDILDFCYMILKSGYKQKSSVLINESFQKKL